MRLKKKWTKPALRPLRVPEEYDPAGGLTRKQWEAARELQRRFKSRAAADPEH